MKKGTVWMAMGLVMILAALGITIYNSHQENQAEKFSAEVAAKLVIEENEDVLETVPADYEKHPEMEMPLMEIDGNQYIGILRIPAYDLELPVMSDWSYQKLRISPCRYQGSVYSGDLIVAAHNYNRHFGQIKDLLPGDTVIFCDVEGNCFTYEVAESEELDAASVEEMESGEWDLTLFTCTYGGGMRVTVRCVLVK